jgi:ribosomal protein L18E
MSKQFKPVVSISALNKLGQKRNKDSIIAVVATVTNDERLLVAPKLTVAALKFTRTARQRIENVCLVISFVRFFRSYFLLFDFLKYVLALVSCLTDRLVVVH